MIILLVGEIGSGKSTAANILAKYNFDEYFFAKPLKDFAISIGFTHEQCYGTQEQKLEINEFWGVSAREFLQKFGSEVCRDVLPKIIPNMKMNGRTLWARVAELHIEQSKPLVISDGRFKDEADLVSDHKGIIIRLVRGSAPSTTTVVSQHKSELETKNIVADYTVDNNGTIPELEAKLVKILYRNEYMADNVVDYFAQKLDSISSQVSQKLGLSSYQEKSPDQLDRVAQIVRETTDTVVQKTAKRVAFELRSKDLLGTDFIGTDEILVNLVHKEMSQVLQETKDGGQYEKADQDSKQDSKQDSNDSDQDSNSSISGYDSDNDYIPRTMRKYKPLTRVENTFMMVSLASIVAAAAVVFLYKYLGNN